MRRWGWLLVLLVAWPALGQGLRLELGTVGPYRMNTARVLADESLTGDLELSGRLWDGRDVPLFRTRLAAETRTEELVFYLDEDIRALECRAGERRATVDLAGLDGRLGGIAPEEAALRNRMRAMDPPIHLMPRGEAPERFTLPGTDLVMAGFQASTTLFGFEVPRRSLWPLAGFAGLALAAAALAARRPRAGRLLLSAGALLAAGAALWLAEPRPTLFSVSFQGAVPGARVAGSLQREVEARPGYLRVAWRGGEGGSRETGLDHVDLVGFWTPAGQGIPLGDVVPAGALLRFSSPPLVTRGEEGMDLSAPDFVTGWVVHGH